MNNRSKPEILAPAGSMESIYAAVRCGADGVYVGGKNFSARANAVNFSAEELKEAADYCHLHGVKLYRAMNVVIFDSECEEFFNEVKYSAEIGIDGLIIQDLGGVMLARAACGDIPLHGSTQMTVHTPEGAQAATVMGLCRIVPARELSLENIGKICKTGIETEVFVHGAQCMCLSGQCYMSAVIGSRSANRGQCAQACRLPFSASGAADSYALSLKDMSLVMHTDELTAAGAASFKIEGRMKRPEYTAAAVTALRHAVDGCADESDMKRLEAVFSRSGFTDGYLTGKIGADMFGYRRKEDVVSANDVLAELAALYKSERKSGCIDFEFTARKGNSAELKFTCGNISGAVSGRIPEAARNRSLSEEDVKKQLSKLGDTRYTLGGVKCSLDDGIMLPASEINRMRREAAAEADRLTAAENTPVYKAYGSMPAVNACRSCSGDISFRIKSDRAENIPADFDGMVILPVSECERLDGDIIKRTAVSLPTFVEDEEKLRERLNALYKKGFAHFYCENLTHLGLLGKMQGIHIHGGSGMNIANSYALMQCREMGFEDAVLSFEMKSGQISAVRTSLPTGITAYGRLPLMTVRNCPVKAERGCGGCTHSVTDRTGRVFPVKCSESYAEIFNCDALETSDRLDSFRGISFAVLDIRGLERREAEAVLSRYRRRAKPEGGFTRGLYNRGVI